MLSHRHAEVLGNHSDLKIVALASDQKLLVCFFFFFLHVVKVFDLDTSYRQSSRELQCLVLFSFYLQSLAVFEIGC